MIKTQTEMSYYTGNGDEVTLQQIRDAFAAGKARIVYGRGDGKTTQSLTFDGIDGDTRGECYSMWEETWTAIPKSVPDACRAAN